MSPGPTPLLIIALQNRRDAPRVRSAVHYLCRQLADAHDLEHLGWGRLALDLYGDLPEVGGFLPRLDERIREATAERRGVPWVQPSPLRTALVALALACDRAKPF